MPVGKPDILPHRENRNGAGRQTTKDVLEADNLGFMGTDVMSGTATAVVVATGSQTIFGSLAGRVLVQQDTTSFDQGIRSVSWVLIRFMAIMVPVVFLINGMTKGNWPDAFLFSLAVAVGLTPEMLPMVVSVNLAKGAIRMAKEKVIVKRISAIQDFGAMDILCTDKTGTLTEDRVMLREHLDMNGNESENVLQLAYLNSSLQTGLKNLMDEAIIEHMESEHRSTGLQHLIKIDEIPFDFMRRRMSVVVADETGQHLFICKGATEEMLEACTQVEIDGQLLPLNEPMRDKARTLIRQRNEGGMRTIAVGYRYFRAHREEYVARDESQLVLAGFVGFLDPPKASAARALAALREHGVKVKVLTGDSEAVVGKICREVGLAPADIVSGHTRCTNDDG